MKRLAFDGIFCDISMCPSTPGGSLCESGRCSQRRKRERLKDIEDIMGDDYDLARLQELAKADKEWRCVVLPCREDDTVYRICESPFYDYLEVVEEPFHICNYYDFGKTIFLTRKEAEVALKKEGQDGCNL